MRLKLIYGVLFFLGLALLGSCRLSKKVNSRLVKTVKLKTLTVKNLSEEVTKNDEIELHLFLLDHKSKILADTLILLEFMEINQSKNIPFLLPVKNQSDRLLITLIEQDNEVDSSIKNHQLLKSVFSDPNWRNSPLSELELSKQLGDDDLLGVETINFYPAGAAKEAFVTRTFKGIHLMDRYEYVLNFTINY